MHWSRSGADHRRTPSCAVRRCGVNALLSNLRNDAECSAVRHASPAVAMDKSPREALRHKPDASIVVAAQMWGPTGRRRRWSGRGKAGAAALACQ